VADRAGSYVPGAVVVGTSGNQHDIRLGGYVTRNEVAAGPSSVTTFWMRGRDPDCVGVVYRYWRVTSTPDFLAASYVGARCGATPLAEVVVLKQKTE